MKEEAIFSVKDEGCFAKMALQVFRYQVSHNRIYQRYIELLGIDPGSIQTPENIPFLPVSFFKTHNVLCKNQTAEKVFYSSGTAGMSRSKHPVAHLSVYEYSFIRGFHHFYGDPSEYCFLALLPSYLEQKDASLVYMMEGLIQKSKYRQSGFFLHNYQALSKQIRDNEKEKIPTLLMGVSYALLDLVDKESFQLKHTLVMETGGMKGRHKEITRQELHGMLTQRFGVTQIHSEYGMTELLSQAYAKAEGRFQTPPWMKVYIRDMYDPFALQPVNRPGGINIMDLANKYAVSFIETGDLGRIHTDGSFEVLGRLDNSDIRGCNLLVAS